MSTSAAATLAKKRVRRQKQIIVVGSVVLLALLGYQLPKLLGGHDSGTPDFATTTLSRPGAGVGSPLAASGTLRDTDGIEVTRDTNQLVSFGLFKSKDPFVQQLSTTPSSAGAAPTTSAAAPAQPQTAGSAPAGAPAAGAPSATASGPSVITQPAPTPTSTVGSTAPVIPPTATTAVPTPATPAPAAPPAAGSSALISTNGVCQQVPLKGTFPANEDIFQLVEIAQDGKSVKIAIAGGSYDSGQATATAKLGEKLTLVNTSDGSRYVILLQAKCTVAAPGTQSAAAAPAVTSPVPAPAPAPAAASTMPIVTDAYDTAPPPSG